MSVTPDDFFIGFGFLPRIRLVKIVGGGVDFDAEGDIVFSSDNVFVLGSRDNLRYRNFCPDFHYTKSRHW